jgi:SAM-dependent methyltransferase
VRKVYLLGDVAGNDPDYWEDRWEGVNLVSLVPKITPSSGILWRLLAELTDAEHLVLEAGCGSGVVVGYLDGLGRRVVGVDRTTTALGSAKRQVPRLQLTAGDVSRFPFPSARFDRVISLGVVEHFEGGAQEPLVEHHRILKPGGALLITVPRVGPVKRWNDFLNFNLGGRGVYRSRGRIVAQSDMPSRLAETATFHQYEYPRRAFRALLEKAGFRVVWIRPFMVGPGLGESRLIQRLASRRSGHRSAAQEANAMVPTSSGVPEHTYAAPPPPSGPGMKGYLREALLLERGRGRSSEALTRLSQWIFGHMNFALAVREGDAEAERSGRS